jgi:hypothetical protein
MLPPFQEHVVAGAERAAVLEQARAVELAPELLARARLLQIPQVLAKPIRARVAGHEPVAAGRTVERADPKEHADESFTAIYSAAGGHLAFDGGHFACGRSRV